ncbi:unannotated protein [freshwater metagenome]|uniref:Unannotated protein n=1 Tax=freshwater metagenome TaxID=449393 RepID=A0A6J7D7B1_9ZZZZ
MRFLPGANSGITCATAPTSKSLGLIGRSPGSVTNLVPLFHEVSFNALPGSGPKSLNSKTAGNPAKPAAAANDLLISGRRPKPAACAPSLAVLTNSSRSFGSDFNSCRSAITS